MLAPEGGEVELGGVFNLKVSVDTGGDLTPYIKVGTGPMYTTQGTAEQSTKYNFGSHGAVAAERSSAPAPFPQMTRPRTAPKPGGTHMYVPRMSVFHW